MLLKLLQENVFLFTLHLQKMHGFNRFKKFLSKSILSLGTV
jgi:hypothetical protein